MKQYGAIFDMDGVLINSYRAHLDSWMVLARRHGLVMTEEMFVPTFGRTSRDSIRSLWPQLNLDDATVRQWDAEKEAAWREIIVRDFPEMDGASELLERLSAGGFKLAIGSSGPPENVATVMKCLRNSNLFTSAINGSIVTHGKPHPEVFLKAAKGLGLEASRCVVIEDATVGVAAAKAAGMAVAAITGTTTREALSSADLVVDSLRELSPVRLGALIDGRPTAKQI